MVIKPSTSLNEWIFLKKYVLERKNTFCDDMKLFCVQSWKSNENLAFIFHVSNLKMELEDRNIITFILNLCWNIV